MRKRACDKCHKAKRSCSGVPCAFCQRRRLNCTLNRPLKKFGRPSKHIPAPVVEETYSTGEKSVVLSDGSNTSVEDTNDCWKYGTVVLRQQLSYHFNLDHKEKAVLEQFIDTGAADLFGSRANTFLQAVVPLVFSFDCIKYPILAIAAASGSHFSAFRETQRYRSLAKLGRKDTVLQETGTLAMLLVVLMEILMGDGMDATTYLDEIQKTVSPVCSWLARQDSDLHQIMSDLYFYYQSLLGYNFGIRNGEIRASSFKLTFGLDQATLQTLSQIRTLEKLKDQTSLSSNEFSQFASLIETKIQTASSMSHLGAAIQCACYLQLYQLKPGSDLSTGTCLNALLDNIKAIQTPSECQLLFPLLIAGTAATTIKDQNYILDRLSVIHSRLKFPFINRYQDLLRHLWRSNESLSIIIKYQFPGLFIL
ncbi:hypothetical protein KL918_003029 [Ogataea parapolymorpha]|uniref:Secreted protein n=1 Tax=Ogataea parapolymorpha (strain ATCC 26012 / BCRC 20466 / JCM 22074 / NRRL Y-7560 / DL-1) TaxID=871575 RepID=W1QA01_OGAPD|nr:putative secreted protein [Ogataea parapolymorpha DL-1]ESW97655.1 putative secreted protein [Ogataea parapolymorpha DL-1]KAG7866834.1 hypothetical protein KL918_003029 [Ogataea parapolymorpha]KAG7871985.1 hypothetical protein KL916_003588 [Ogataea parapolymorpha]